MASTESEALKAFSASSSSTSNTLNLVFTSGRDSIDSKSSNSSDSTAQSPCFGLRKSYISPVDEEAVTKKQRLAKFKASASGSTYCGNLNETLLKAVIMGETFVVYMLLFHTHEVKDIFLDLADNMPHILEAKKLDLASVCLTSVAKGDRTLLMIASEKGNCSITRMLFDAGAPANQVEFESELQLPLLSKQPSWNKSMRVLIREQPTKTSSMPALLLAARQGHIKIIEILLTKGARADMTNSDGLNAIQLLFESGHWTSEFKTTIKMLVHAGADLNAYDDCGKTTLYRAIMRNDSPAALILIELDASVNLADRFGIDPLSIAARQGNLSLVHALVRKGACVDGDLDAPYTPLWKAATKGHTEIVQFLLLNGADMERKGPRNTVYEVYTTPLQEATYGSTSAHARTRKLLLDSGANDYRK